MITAVIAGGGGGREGGVRMNFIKILLKALAGAGVARVAGGSAGRGENWDCILKS